VDPFGSATEMAAAVRHREVSPLELLDACLERVDRLNPEINAVVWRNDGDARTEAARLSDHIAAGDIELPPFAGVPIPIKDLNQVAGWPVSYGSSAGPPGPSTQDDLVVAALRRAGFVLTGRTNTPEFGPLPVAENLRYGVTRNPWDTDRTPGGSSGGAAAAVASGMFALAHGNDGGGSLRIPASCTGLVGLKASRGRVPAEVPGWMGAVVEGVLTRTVADAAAVLDEISGPDRLAWYNAPVPDRPFADEVGTEPGQLRVALTVRAPLGLPVDPAAVDAVRHTGKLLESLGHKVSDIEIELFPEQAMEPFLSVVHSGLAAYRGVDLERVEPHNRASFEMGSAVDSIEFVAALGELQRVTRRVVARWGEQYDILITPTMAILPPVAGTVLERAHAEPSAIPADALSMAVFTAPFNVSGLPSVSLPIGQAVPPGGELPLPVGVQLVAGPWQESVLFRVAAQIEEADPWRGRRPPPPFG
jgi:amidase